MKINEKIWLRKLLDISTTDWISLFTNNGYYDISLLLSMNAKINSIFGVRNCGKGWQVYINQIRPTILKGGSALLIRRTQPEVLPYSETIPKDITYILNAYDEKTQTFIDFEYKDEDKRYNYQIFKSSSSKNYLMYHLMKKTIGYDNKGNETYTWNDLGLALVITNLRSASILKSVDLQGWPNMKTILFEEAISENGIRMSREAELLLSLISTVERDKTDLKLFILANTIDFSSDLMTHFRGCFDFTTIPSGQGRCYTATFEISNPPKHVEKMIVKYAFEIPIASDKRTITSLQSTAMQFAVLNEDMFNYMVNSNSLSFNDEFVIGEAEFFKYKEKKTLWINVVNKQGTRMSILQNGTNYNLLVNKFDSIYANEPFYALDKESEVLYSARTIIDNRIANRLKTLILRNKLFFSCVLHKEAIAQFLKQSEKKVDIYATEIR